MTKPFVFPALRATGCLGIVLASFLSPDAPAAEPVDFKLQVKPILESACVACHGPEKAKAGLRLDTRTGAVKGGDNGPALVPGNPDQSPLFTSTILPADNEAVMPPPQADRLTREQTDVLKAWIEQAAPWPDGVTLQQISRVKFAKDIQPILEFNCVACHHEGHAKGGLRLDNKADAFKGGDSGAAIVPFDANQSPLYTSTIVPEDDEKLMPPKAKNGPLAKDAIALLRAWIEQGASWPEGITLTPQKLEQAAGGDNLELVKLIHKKIVANLDVKTAAGMRAYTNTIPGTEVEYGMVAIPGGEFLMGSPDSEPGRKPDEGPQHRVKISPFWMGQEEVLWEQYLLFMYAEDERKLRQSHPTAAADNQVSDAISRPTRPYVDMSFGMGKKSSPAISMTQHAANKFCQWLSAKTGHFYRLPTEAEWEYACRAGTTTAYSFGNDASKLDEYAWFADNSDSKYQRVGKKKPNPWGLYDMHGNVLEWTLDQYDPDYYKTCAAQGVVTDPWNVATKPYPQVARGGSWDDEPAALRSAARRGSNRAWKRTDPQLPKSIWYHTDAQFLGLRIVRPLAVPPPEEMMKYWTSGVEKD